GDEAEKAEAADEIHLAIGPRHRREEQLNRLQEQTVSPLLARSYREVDFIRRLGFFGLITWLLTSLVRAPLVLFGAVFGVFGQISDFVTGIFGGPISKERKEIRLNPAYNYGIRQTVRETIMAPDYQVYFQRADGAQFNQALDQQVLSAITDLLKRAGVDTKALGEQASVIQQSNVTINASQQSNVSIGGQAAVGSFLNRLSGQRPQGQAAPPAKTS
ncbi:MAG: hypothetical protein AAFR16_12125, partial [Pseudomonadota bacterium]